MCNGEAVDESTWRRDHAYDLNECFSSDYNMQVTNAIVSHFTDLWKSRPESIRM
jgi:hypothetical protein